MNNPLTELNSKELEMILYILNSEVVHYSDIGKNIGKSRKTITKYLNEIEPVLAKYNVKLIRKRNVGVYFEGDTDKLNRAIHASGFNSSPKNKDERITFILSKLLLSDESQTIQDLADASFVSRGTMENDFKEIKRMLAEHDAFIENTSDGVKVVASESSRRKLISELLTMYWGKTLYSKNNIRLEDNTIILVKILERNFALKIPEYEKQYINIHILAAEGQLSNDEEVSKSESNFQQKAITKFLKENITDYDQILINGIMLHLSSALKRLYLGLNLHNPYTQEIKRNFPQAFNEALDLCTKLEQQFNVSMNEDEVAYVALHIEAFLERPKNMVTAVIVCSTGLGTARLLNQRIKKFFSNTINVLRVTSVQDLKHNSIKEDLIISTINFDVSDKPVVIVPPFLDNNSVKAITEEVNKILNKTHESKSFINLLKPDLILIDSDKKERNQVIQKIGDRIVEVGYGKENIADAAIKREQLASTAMDNVAMPHAPIEYVKKPFIAVYVNRDGIDWHGNTVNIVFFLAMNKQVHDEIDSIYKYFNNVLEDKKLLKRIVNSSKGSEILKLLSGETNE